MPQFLPNVAKTAKVVMSNPKGVALSYTGCLYLGSLLASERSFSLGAGEEKQVSFPITTPSTAGTYPVLLYVYSGGQVIALFQATESVVITGLALGIKNPKNGSAAFAWDVRLYDVNTRQWQASPLLNLTDTYIFTPTSSTYILLVHEHYLYGGSQTSVMYGPYLLTGAPTSGSFIWDAQAEKLSGIPSINMPNVSNSCVVGGTLSFIQWDPSRGGELHIVVDEALDYSGQNWGKYFIGSTIVVYSNYPFRAYVEAPYYVVFPAISAGQRVRAWAKMAMGQYLYQWEATSVKYYPDYPASAYQFAVSGSYPSLNIAGNVSSFSIVALIIEDSYIHVNQKILGPVTGWKPPFIYGLGTAIWCHPDPNRTFPVPGGTPVTRPAEVDNWQMVYAFH